MSAPAAKISFFERNLTWWVLGCIVVGISLGKLMPGVFQAISHLQIAEVNLVVAVLIWLMIIPMLLKIDFARMGEVAQHARGIGVTLAINWLVKPFSMALLAWIFIRTVHRHGVRLEQSVQRRTQIHAVAGRDQRRHHAVRLRSHRRPSARVIQHHRAVGYAGDLGRAVHRCAGHHQPALAQGVAWRS